MVKSYTLGECILLINMGYYIKLCVDGFHSYQSAPFFVLDEIDAALDNTNINRVSYYECVRNNYCRWLPSNKIPTV